MVVQYCNVTIKLTRLYLAHWLVQLKKMIFFIIYTLAVTRAITFYALSVDY